MRKVLKVVLGVCAVVSLAALAEAQSRDCRPISGSGTGIFQDASKSIAQSDLNEKIAKFQEKAPGKVKAKGKGPEVKCSGPFDLNCTAKQQVCAPTNAWRECPCDICSCE